MMNHQTPFDQFFVGMSFRQPVYYVATEDIFSLGWLSDLLRWLVAPIPIKKQTTDVQAVMNCIKVVREGGNIAIAPEGNRTYSGKTEYMNNSIAPLAKKLKARLYKRGNSPAKAIGYEGEIGSIAPGKRADFILCDENLNR